MIVVKLKIMNLCFDFTNIGGEDGLIHKPFRACYSTGKIHNMNAHCSFTERIKYGNYEDFNCYDEAEKEIDNHGKKAAKCSHCDWPKSREAN